MREKISGTDNVAILPSLLNLGGALSDAGRQDDARVHLERALALSEAKQGPNDPMQANILNNLAVIDQETGKLDDAMAMFERSRKISEAIKGPESADVVETYLNEAVVLKRQKKLAEAVALEQRILPMAEKAFGPEHPKVAMVLVNLGYHEEALDKPKDALDHHTRALAIFEKKFGKDGAYNSYALLGMGQDLIDLQRPADALPLYERAVEIRTKAGMPPAALKEATDSVAFAKKKLHRQAAVDVDGAAVEVVALEDELHGEPDVLGQADAADRDRGDQRVARLLVHALRHRRLDHAGRDRADADAERRELARPGHGVGRERGLRRRRSSTGRGCRGARSTTC